jgi:transposase
LLAQRGKSKDKRSDLKIVGLSLLISEYFDIPLFSKIYPGNANDAKQFSQIIDAMKERMLHFNIGVDSATIVFDKGNNSQMNFNAIVSERPFKFHFVGSIRKNQLPELQKIKLKNYKALHGEQFGDTKTYRTTKKIYDNEYTIVATHNPELLKKQLRSIETDIEKCGKELKLLSKNLSDRKRGIITKGRGYSYDSLEKKIKNILSKEHMSKIFDYQIISLKNNNFSLKSSVNKRKYSLLKEHNLGKTVLITNRHDWTTEEIVAAYRAQFHVENCFKQLKNHDFLSFRPVRHFTDHNIRVHAFFCVLALMLCSVLHLEFHNLGYTKNINNLLLELSQIKRYTHYIVQPKKIVCGYTHGVINGVFHKFFTKFSLFNYL